MVVGVGGGGALKTIIVKLEYADCHSSGESPRSSKFKAQIYGVLKDTFWEKGMDTSLQARNCFKNVTAQKCKYFSLGWGGWCWGTYWSVKPRWKMNLASGCLRRSPSVANPYSGSCTLSWVQSLTVTLHMEDGAVPTLELSCDCLTDLTETARISKRDLSHCNFSLFIIRLENKMEHFCNFARYGSNNSNVSVCSMQ